jgi:hypothetical protein
MLLRIRGPSGTYKVRCEPSTTYAELIAEVEKQCEWGGDPGALRLSLNKKEPLELETANSVGSGGLRGGDLLYILADAAAVVRAPPPPVASTRQQPAPAPGSRPPSAAAAAAAAAAERRAAEANAYRVAAPPAPTPAVAVAAPQQVRTVTVRYPVAADMLVEMGFSREQSDAALGMCDGNADRAVELITSGALEGGQTAPTGGGARAESPGAASDSAEEMEEAEELLPPPPALRLRDVYSSARAALLQVLAEAGFEEQAQEPAGRHTFCIAAFPGVQATVQLSTLGDYVNVHAMAWDTAPVHLLTYGGPGTALGFSLTDLLCSLVTEWKLKVVRPMLLELTLGAMLQTASTTVPAEILAVALHGVMLSSGFVNKAEDGEAMQGAGEATASSSGGGLPAGWNLGGGSFSFEYTLSAPPRSGATPPSVLLKAVAMGDRMMVHAMVEETTGEEGAGPGGGPGAGAASGDKQSSAPPPVFDASFSIREHTDAAGIAQLQQQQTSEEDGCGADALLTLAPLAAPAVFAAACSSQLLGKLLAQISPPPTMASLPAEVRSFSFIALPATAHDNRYLLLLAYI